jgi:uncharacterized protein (TIGR03083 family)
MDAPRYLEAIAAAGDAIVDAARRDLTAPIAACPGWTVAEVVGHLGRVYTSVADIVSERLITPPTAPVPRPPSGPAVIDYYAAALERLLAALGATAFDVPVYTWSGQGVAGFYHRRMAHETGAHRVDVQAASGPVDAFDPAVAADGISELYEVVLPFGLARMNKAVPTESLHLHQSDGGGEWTLRQVGETLQVGRIHEAAAAELRGAASDLFVFAWNRGRAPALEVRGDVAVVDAWARLAP